MSPTGAQAFQLGTVPNWKGPILLARLAVEVATGRYDHWRLHAAANGMAG